MPEKITLTRYLKGRGEVKALTHIEALAFGVPYPLQPGWPAKYGATEITEAMIEDLRARIETAKQSTASKARRGLRGIGREDPDGEISQADRTFSSTGISNSGIFPGFALRRARRFCR